MDVTDDEPSLDELMPLSSSSSSSASASGVNEIVVESDLSFSEEEIRKMSIEANEKAFAGSGLKDDGNRR